MLEDIGADAVKTGMLASAAIVAVVAERLSRHGVRRLVVDPVMIAGSLIMALQTVVSRNIDPTQTAIVTIGTVHAGTAANVIPESATLELSIRSFDEGVRARLEQRITEIVNAQVMCYGGAAEIEYERGYPVVVNSAAETAKEISLGIELDVTGRLYLDGEAISESGLRQRPTIVARGPRHGHPVALAVDDQVVVDRHEAELKPAGVSSLDAPGVLRSETVPFTFELLDGEKRPAVRVTHVESARRWNV